MNDQQKIQLGPEEIRSAARLGVELFNTKGVITVDSVTALSQDFQILNLLLVNLSEGAVQIGNPMAQDGGEAPSAQPEDEGNGDS